MLNFVSAKSLEEQLESSRPTQHLRPLSLGSAFAVLQPRRTYVFLFILLACVSVVGCGDDDVVGGDPPCSDTEIGDHLTRVFYWGDGGPLDLIPNEGEPAGNARQPLWIDDSTILTLSETLTNGQAIQGIFAISVDPATLEFDSIQVFELPNVRWAYDYDAASGQLFVTHSSSPGDFQIELCHFAGRDVVIDDVLVNSQWQPSGVCLWPGRDGIIFYGTDPSTLIRGFYVHDVTGDSLLFNVDITFDEARSFGLSPDGSRIYYGTSNGSLFGPSTVYSSALDGSSVEIVHEARGVFGALDVNPIDGRLVIERYFFGNSTDLPASELVLVDLDDGSATSLDVRTYESSCLFVLARNPSWSPDGTRFAFSGGATSSEDGTLPLAIWSYHVTE